MFILYSQIKILVCEKYKRYGNNPNNSKRESHKIRDDMDYILCKQNVQWDMDTLLVHTVHTFTL